MSIMILTNTIICPLVTITRNVRYVCLISFFTILGGYHYPNIQNQRAFSIDIILRHVKSLPLCTFKNDCGSMLKINTISKPFQQTYSFDYHLLYE